MKSMFIKNSASNDMQKDNYQKLSQGINNAAGFFTGGFSKL